MYTHTHTKVPLKARIVDIPVYNNGNYSETVISCPTKLLRTSLLDENYSARGAKGSCCLVTATLAANRNTTCLQSPQSYDNCWLQVTPTLSLT